MSQIVDLLEPIGLDALVQEADLQTRVDRKYLVVPEVIEKVINELSPSLKALEFVGTRHFRYQSVYFDTGDFRSFHEHLQGRRHRFKIRTRTYLDSGECQLEVKLKGGRSETVKSRLPYDPADALVLTSEGIRFIECLIDEPLSTVDLRPVLTSNYTRSTLVDVEAQTRMTCDVALRWHTSTSSTDNLVRYVLVETKTSGPLSAADVLLRTYGHRPMSISKYCLGVALLNSEVRANPWHRTLRRHFDWKKPERAADLSA